MCGIAGVVADSLPDFARARVETMKATLARRGPDLEGTESWPAAVLGHRRLSIFDVSEAGRQPMLSLDRQIGVVFNGSIYNFPVLRRELEDRGYRFHSRTDTEVLVHGYECWGIDRLVHKLRGMFAIAIWDNRRRVLTLVRDRLGVKPLIYCATNDTIAFASTIDALHDAGYVEHIDDSAIRDFLEFGWIPDDKTIFQGAVKLPAATILEWCNGRLSQRRYWQVPPVDSVTTFKFRDAVAETEEMLIDCVRMRLFADVPVGALLSGGIDSALVCWAMSQLKANITAFTVGTPGSAGDETAEARQTAKALGIPHEVIELPLAERTPIAELTSAYGEPFACASALGMLHVSKAVKSKATVLLTGDGGDDIFLGYPRHRHMWLAQRAAQFVPRPLAAMWPSARRVLQRWPQLQRPIHFMDYATEGLSAAVTNSASFAYYANRGLLGSRLQSVVDERTNLRRSLDSARRLLPEFLEQEWRMQFVGEYMTKVDGATMFHAVEARSPFLDHVLWEFAASLSYKVRLHGGELKAILREIVRKRISPRIAAQKKRGFTIPVEKWLATHWKPELEEISKASVLGRNQWIEANALERTINEAVASQYVPPQLWRLLVLEHWMRVKAVKTA